MTVHQSFGTPAVILGRVRVRGTRAVARLVAMAAPAGAAPREVERTCAVVLFARLPVPGKVKTRLAAGVGAEAAASFYRRVAERAFAATAACASTRSRTLFFSDASEARGIERWVADAGDAGMRLAPQCASRDLGDRMRHALNHALATGGEDGGPCDRAVVVGTDVPDLDAAHVDAAAELLERHDVVFGPAVDGGYYLLGVRRRRDPSDPSDPSDDDDDPSDSPSSASESAGGAHPALFRGVPWSTSTVLRDSIAAANGAGLRVAPVDALPTLRDVDTRDELAAWVREAEARGGHPLIRVAEETLAGRRAGDGERG